MKKNVVINVVIGIARYFHQRSALQVMNRCLSDRWIDPWGAVVKRRRRRLNKDDCAPFDPMGHWFVQSGGGCCCCWNGILSPSQENPQPSEESCAGQEHEAMKAGRVCPLPSERFTGSRGGREPGI